MLTGKICHISNSSNKSTVKSIKRTTRSIGTDSSYQHHLALVKNVLYVVTALNAVTTAAVSSAVSITPLQEADRMGGGVIEENEMKTLTHSRSDSPSGLMGMKNCPHI